MQIVGEKVIHKVFGKGIVIDYKDDHISVYFNKITDEKKFVYPDAFEKFLTFESSDLQDRALAILSEKNKKRQEERLRKQEEQRKSAYEQPIPVQASKGVKKTRKLPPRKNLAFKLNFCDGGASTDSIGFKAVCSDDIICYNIDKAKRSWCSFKDCPCRKYHDGLISREELDAVRRDDLLCYESIALSDWIAHAGTDLKGINAGKARRLPNAQLGSLAALTTRYPGTSEKDRIIVGVFIIDSASEGDDSVAGTVSAKAKYKIEIRPDEAQKLKYWNYYRNAGNPDSIKWGSGLYRFFNDEDALRLLEDIATVKRGKEDHRLALEIIEYFKQLHES